MKRAFRGWRWLLPALCALLLAPAMYAANDVMGEIQFEGRSQVEKDSGVWVDGQYVGYLKELHGSKKVMLLPGEHTITVRQNGYQDFSKQLAVHPGETRVVRVAMEKGVTGGMPSVTAEVKISVTPPRAAVFLDGRYVGHAREFGGVGRGMLIAPGSHEIQVALPGYQTFATNINPLANQKVEIKTDLVKTNALVTDPLLNTVPSEEAQQPAEEPGAMAAPMEH